MTDETAVLRRNLPGQKTEEWFGWDPVPFDELDCTLAVQIYIRQCLKENPANSLVSPPSGIDENTWKYECIRRFVCELNDLCVVLQGVCSAETCKPMTATDQWIYLCAAHKEPQECAAIDYTRHTLDGATNFLNSKKFFPSRLDVKESSVHKLSPHCRRVYRIFSHAYFHHRTQYDEFEERTKLCERYSEFVLHFKIIPKDQLLVPTLANSSESDA